MYGNIGEGLASLVIYGGICLAVSVPLAIWKLVEIGIWCYNHIEIGIK